MKYYGVFNKIIIIIGFSLFGLYYVSSSVYKKDYQQFINRCMNYSSNCIQSACSYSYKLSSDIIKRMQDCFVQDQVVTIQNLSQDQESFYSDNDKCLPGPGLESCRKNDEFFSETYFGYGDKNIDPILNNDYSHDPID